MIRFTIVANDPVCVAQLQQHIERYKAQTRALCHVTCFRNVNEFMTSCKTKSDFIFFDMSVGEDGSAAITEAVQRLECDVVVIFIMAPPQCVMKRQAEGAQVQYCIPKPVDYYEFFHYINRAVLRKERRGQRRLLNIKNKDGIQVVDSSQIYLIEANGWRLTYYTANEIVCAFGSIRRVERRLSDANTDFFRCGRRQLVNLEHITVGENGDILTGGRKVLISQSKRKDFLDAVNHYLCDGGEL